MKNKVKAYELFLKQLMSEKTFCLYSKLFCIALLFSTLSANAQEYENLSFAEKKEIIRQINEMIEEKIDLNLSEIAVLLDARRGRFALKDYIESTGKFSIIMNLQEKSYVKINIVGSPDGELVEIVPTNKGVSLKNMIIENY